MKQLNQKGRETKYEPKKFEYLKSYGHYCWVCIKQVICNFTLLANDWPLYSTKNKLIENRKLKAAFKTGYRNTSASKWWMNIL